MKPVNEQRALRYSPHVMKQESLVRANTGVFRQGGLSYVHIPTTNPSASAAFYSGVFGWRMQGDPDRPSFEDGGGQVIGHLMPGEAVAPDAGIVPYVYVERLEETVDRVATYGGAVVKPIYPEGDVRVALFRDPAGNLVGAWQRG